MSKAIRIGTVGLASVPLSLLGASLVFAQATTTPPNTGAGAATEVNLLVLAASAAVVASGVLYLRRAMARSQK